MARPKTEMVSLKPDVIYDADGFATILRISRNSLNVRRHNGTITVPVIRVGNRNYFKGSDILAYLDKNTDPTGATRSQSLRPPSPGRPRLRRRAA